MKEDLRNYIIKSLRSGRTNQEIMDLLIADGWNQADVEAVFIEIGISSKSSNSNGQSGLKKSLITLALAVVLLGSTTTYLWIDRIDLSKTNDIEVQNFYANLSKSQVSFSDVGEMVFPDEQKFITQKNEYIHEQKDFIEVDLRTMKLTLYESGIYEETVNILSKGEERGWWETPTGNYKVLNKSLNGYSSIGNVWMPYSIQFYGNYLIHGWPHYNDGTPVPQGYSGGCVRLSNENAKKVYNFVNNGTPVLVLEDKAEYNFGTLTSMAQDVTLPSISARSFLITDISSGNILLEKEAEEILPVASLTKLMTAIVAHEVIYLGRSIKVSSQILASVSQIFYPVEKERYLGLDLLYPLLMQSSNNSADLLASFIGDELFIQNMNNKAKSLQMDDTKFVDPSGIGSQNLSTTKDLAKLLQYIYYNRQFLFDIGKGVTFKNVGIIELGDTIDITDLKNFNEFVDRTDLIGVKNGQTTAARQTMTTVWDIHTTKGSVPVSIVVLGSENAEADTEALLKWVKNNFVVL